MIPCFLNVRSYHYFVILEESPRSGNGPEDRHLIVLREWLERRAARGLRTSASVFSVKPQPAETHWPGSPQAPNSNAYTFNRFRSSPNKPMYGPALYLPALHILSNHLQHLLAAESRGYQTRVPWLQGPEGCWHRSSGPDPVPSAAGWHRLTVRLSLTPNLQQLPRRPPTGGRSPGPKPLHCYTPP